MAELYQLYLGFVYRVDLICNTTVYNYVGDDVHSPSDEEFISTEYCYTFVHSALEDFVESISTKFCDLMIPLFLKTKIPNSCVLSLALLDSVDLSKTEKNEIEAGKKNDNYDTHFVFIEEKIKLCRKKLGRIISNNNGVSRKYIVNILPYVGIDMPNPLLVDRVDQIAAKRGYFAHKFKEGIKNATTANEAFDACVSALSFATELYKNAKNQYEDYLRIIENISSSKTT